MKCRYIPLIVAFLQGCAVLSAQSLQEQYDAFQRQSLATYTEWRDKANSEYADWLLRAWQLYQQQPAIPQPDDEEVKPTVMPEEESDKPVDDNPITIEGVIEQPKPNKPPTPVVPEEATNPNVTEIKKFSFYGTEMAVPWSESMCFSLTSVDRRAIADCWTLLSGEPKYAALARSCLQLRDAHRLGDYWFLSMLKGVGVNLLGEDTNEATMLTAFLYCQSGYKMRLGVADGRLYLLFASHHSIYNHPYYKLGDGENYYPVDCSSAQMLIADIQFPNEQPLSLVLTASPALTCNASPERTLSASSTTGIRVQASVNRNLIELFASYPSSEVGSNSLSRWAMYANTPMSQSVKETLYPALRNYTDGVDTATAVGRLLNWVQTAFVYQYDDEVWGCDRAFFAEETLYYPFCDCEDRSILFSRLVRDLLDLDVVLVFYPGHLATAIEYPDGSVKGDYIMLNGHKYVIADPTYINAPIGCTMPGMDNASAKVIRLN